MDYDSGHPVSSYKSLTINITDKSYICSNDNSSGFYTQLSGVTNISYTGTQSDVWSTIVLPFTVASNSDIQFYQLSDVEEIPEQGYQMDVCPVATVKAGTPCAIKRLSNSTDIVISASNTDVDTHINTVSLISSLWKINGQYNPLTAWYEYNDNKVTPASIQESVYTKVLEDTISAAMTYDESKTTEENMAAQTTLNTQLTTDLYNQRKSDFETYRDAQADNLLDDVAAAIISICTLDDDYQKKYDELHKKIMAIQYDDTKTPKVLKDSVDAIKIQFKEELITMAVAKEIQTAGRVLVTGAAVSAVTVAVSVVVMQVIKTPGDVMDWLVDNLEAEIEK